MIVGALMTMALAQAPAGPGTVSGRVVDAGGRPAAGVEVLLSGTGTFRLPVLARATSDKDGAFRIEVPAGKDRQRTQFGVGVWAYDPDRGLAGQAFTPTAVPAAGSVRLKLGGPLHTAVRVVGPDGKPVAGAVVRPSQLRVPGGWQPTSTFPPPGDLADRLAATTDADGRGEIRGCRAEDVDFVRVEAAAFGQQGTALGAEVGGARTIALAAAGRLTGRVQVADPNAARGLEVWVLSRPRDPRQQTNGVGIAKTDAEGRFAFPALAAGKLAINVLPPEGVKLKPKLPSGLVIEPGKTTEVTIPMEGPARERTVSGRVVDREGRPVAGAVVFQSGDSPTRTEATTGADGPFTLGGVVARSDVRVRAEAGLPLRRPGHRARSQRRDGHHPHGPGAAPDGAEDAPAPPAPR